MTQPLPEPWIAALASWGRAQARAHTSPRTVEARRYALRPFALTHPEPFAVTPTEVAAWIAAPERWSPIDPKRMRSALHTFYVWAVSQGLIDANPAPVRGRTRAPITPAWSAALDDFQAAERTGRKAATTTARRVAHLELYATTSGQADPWTVTAADLAAWVRAQDWSAATAASARSALRAFYGWALEAGRISTNPGAYLSTMAVTAEPRAAGSRGPLAHPTPRPWAGPLRLYGRHVLARGQSRHTAKLRDLHLRRVARDLAPLGPWDVTLDDLLDWFARHTLQPSTRRSMQGSLRAFYGWAVEAGHIDHNPAMRLPTVRESNPSPRPASETAVRAAILAAEPRERLMLRMAAELGMRRAEIAHARHTDLIERDGHWSLLVRGKGSRDRVLPVPDALAAAIRSLPDGYLFPSDASATGHLTASTVGHLIGQLLPDGVSAHALRHRFATRAYELDHDVFAVQRLLGHARPETTQRYVATGDETLRSTVDRLAAWTDVSGARAAG